MSYEEKGVWVYLVSGAFAYGLYLALLLGQGVALVDTDYVVPLLVSIGISIGLSIVGRIALEIAKPSDNYRKDERDREIDRFGDHRGQWFLVAGAVGALVLALVDADTFWIANAIYLGFWLWAAVGSVLKLVAYRRGF